LRHVPSALNKLSDHNLRWTVIALSVLAAIRVFVFAAAFPFFNNVDEQAHVDLVVKYAEGKPPHGIEPFASESAIYFALYSTPEYLIKRQRYGGEYPAPNWLLPSDQRQKIIDDELPLWESRPNHESGEPPLYYASAGAWMNSGRAVGLRGLTLLYWIRFLNIAIAAVLVWIGFRAARSTFPENQFVQVAVPMLLALWPQSAFYSVQGDALMPLSFGLAFLGLTKLLQGERTHLRAAIWTGLAAAATCLIKTSNFPLPLVIAIVLSLKTFARARTESVRGLSTNLLLFVLSFAIPIGIWFAWNHHHFGDLTATKSKIELLGWTRKPFSQWWSNPIFTPHGLSEFWPGLIASFWRGEFVWGMERMASPPADGFYSIATAVVILAGAVLLFRRSEASKDRQLVLWSALLCFLSVVAFMVLLSISFDFRNCPYPSREHPYFTSGRLLNATAVPFFLLFAYVIDRIGDWMKQNWPRWVLLGATALLLAVSQIHVNAPAFASRYNFFHRQSP
jgi:Predicted membrane protein (DUF2142)